METTITSANSVFMIVVDSIYPNPIQLQGYATDKAFVTDSLEIAETLMGVDGRMSAGYVPNPTKQTITLQADSPSKEIFNYLVQTMKTAREVFFISGTLILPATGESFTLNRGILTTVKQIPDAQKLLQPQDYIITWESVDASLL
jgi:hypothetical protein